jgi:hypothetical protein
MGTEVPSRTLLEYWQQQIDAWQRSGLSGAQFCVTQQLVYHRFVYWRRKLVPGDRRPTENSPASTGFVTVKYRPEEDVGLSVSLPNGLVIRGIRTDNVTVVRQLLDTL